MDTTFFGNEFGVLVLMDSLSKKVVYHKIVNAERVIYYRKAINELREKDYKIQSITCDGRRGLLKDILNTPIQMCQFHQVAIVIRRIARKPKSEAGKELKILIKTLKTSSKNKFYINLHHWYLKHKNFLNERSSIPDKAGKYPFKHRNLRSAYSSLKRHEEFLFTFEKYPELKIEKTTNRLEGLFSELKRKLALHNGLSKKNKIMFIKDFLNEKS